MFKGGITALITPFNEDGSIDFESFRLHIEDQITRGISAILPVGTTGESPTLSHKENLEVVEFAIKVSNGRVPVIAGTGSNSTKEAIEMTKTAKKMGADASLQVVPYYNKPTQEGIYQHYKAIADEVDLPLIVYNIRGRSAVNVETSTLMRLAEHPNIVGVKEASGDISQMMDVISSKPDDFCVLVGDDNIIFPFVALGGDGVISVISNIYPDKVEELINLTNAGKLEEARALHYELLPMCKAMFLETSPIPVKSAMSMMGKCKEVFRLPLCSPTVETKDKLKTILKENGLI